MLCRSLSSWLIVLIPAVLACGGDAGSPAPPHATAENRTIERIVVATGTIEAEGEVEVRPRIAGIVEKIEVVAGDDVQEGQILLEIERELIAAQAAEARAGVEAANVELRYAKIEIERASRLKDEGASSDSQLDQARVVYDRAVAALSRARAALETLEVQLRHATVRAPVTGRVLDVAVEVGSAVSPVTSVTGGSVLVRLAATERLHLEGQVDENDIALVRLDQPARIRTEAFGDRVFEGRVSEIAPMGHRIQNVTYFEVKIAISDPDAHLLRPRMSGDAEIVAATIEDALVVPETALRYAGDSIYVDVLGDGTDASSQSVRRDVTVGVIDGDRVQILDGISPGEKVLLQ